MDLDRFRERTASGDCHNFVETAAGRAANDSLHDARTRLKISSQ